MEELNKTKPENSSLISNIFNQIDLSKIFMAG